MNVGETIFELLSRLAQIRGVLLVSDGTRGLQITQAGAARANTSLQLGGNILAAEATHSVAQRFHTYVVYGQGLEIDAMQQVIGSAIDPDPAVRSARITHVDPIEPSDLRMAGDLARWVANTRRAQGQRGTFTVLGWQDGTGANAPVWQPNTIVTINDAWSRFQGQFLIAGVEFEVDEEVGEITKLQATPRAAYTLIPHEEWPDDVLMLPPGSSPPAAEGE